MDLQVFLANIPVTTRERNSAVKDALDNNKIYISLVTKNNKKHFKIYFKDGNTIKSKQLKVTDVTKEYILKNISIVTLSDTAREFLNIQ